MDALRSDLLVYLLRRISNNLLLKNLKRALAKKDLRSLWKESVSF